MPRRALALLTLLAGPAVAEQPGGALVSALQGFRQATEAQPGHVVEAAGLRALHPWTRATGASGALVFVELANLSAGPVTLIEASAEVARSAELVGFALIEGRPAHLPVGPTTLDPGMDMALEPFGLAIALHGLARPLRQGERLRVTLLTDRGPLALLVDVEAADAMRHSHAGHAH